MGGIIGIIYDKDRLLLDTDTLKRSVSIANALHLKVSFEEGFIVMNRQGGPEGKKIEIPTLKNAKIEEKIIQVNFKSLLFSDSIEIKKTESLKTAPEKMTSGTD